MVVVRVEPMSHTQITPDGMNTVVSPVLFGMRLCGLYMPWKHGGKLKKYLSLCYCVLINAFVILNVVRYSTVFFNETSLTGTMTSSLATLTFFLATSYISVSMSLSAPHYLTSWIEDVRLYQQQFGSAVDYKRARKAIIKYLVFDYVVAVGMTLVFMFSDLLFESLSRHMSPCGYLHGNPKTICNGFVSLGTAFSVLRMYMMFILFLSISHCMYKDLNVLSERFKQELMDNTDTLEDVMLCYHVRHEQMCDLILLADKLVSHIAFSVYAFGIPIICFFLFGIIRGSLLLEEIVYCLSTLVVVIIFMVVITLYSSLVSQKAHEPLTHIFHCDWSALSLAGVNKVNLFVHRLTSERIGFTVYGLFTIDRSTILMITGTILTYAVVVLQISPSTADCSAICEQHNITKL